MKKNNFFTLIFLFFAAAFLNALGANESKAVQITGRVRMVKSGPQSSVVISSEDREWHIESGEREKLALLQQQTVTVKGREYYEDLTFANGISAGRRYYLKDIKIIKTSQ